MVVAEEEKRAKVTTFILPTFTYSSFSALPLHSHLCLVCLNSYTLCLPSSEYKLPISCWSEGGNLVGMCKLAVGIWGSSCFLERPLNDPRVFSPEPLESSVGVDLVAFLAFFVTSLGLSVFESAVNFYLPVCFLRSINLLSLSFPLFIFS